MRPSAALLGLLLVLIGSCVGGDEATGPAGYAELDLTLQPALIPSAADGSALPVHRIRTTVARVSDGAVLREQRFEVSPSDGAWTLEVQVPVGSDATEVVVHLYLIHVADDGTEAVQFSGRTAPLTVSLGSRLDDVDADIVRGPPGNLTVTDVTIVSAPDTLYVGESAHLSATVASIGSLDPLLYWTSLDPSVVAMEDSTAIAIAAGAAVVVASAGAHADTASVVVIVPGVDSVRVSPDSADVQVGQTRPYTVQLFDAHGNVLTGREVTWTTADCACATVDGFGVVTGVSAGVTTVRATSEGVFDEAIVRVTAPPAGVGTNSWVGTSGNWSDPAHWSLGRVPAAGDSVRIQQNGDYTVTLDVDATVAALVVGGATDIVTLDVGDHDLSVAGDIDVDPLGWVQVTTGAISASVIFNEGSVRVLGAATVDADVENYDDWRISGPESSLTMTRAGGAYFYNEGALAVDTTGILNLGPEGGLEFAGGSATFTEEGVAVLGPGGELVLDQNLAIDGPHIILVDSEIDQFGANRLTIGPESMLQLAATSQVVVAPRLEVQGLFLATGPEVLMEDSLIVAPGGTVGVDGSGGSIDYRTIAVQNGGTIVLSGIGSVSFGPGGNPQPLVNGATGSIQIAPGGERVINGQLLNQGQILVAGATTLRRATLPDGTNPITAAHVNDGRIEIGGGGSLDIELGGASPTFTNSDSIMIGAGATLSVENLASPPGQIINTATGVLAGEGTVDVRAGVPSGVNHGVVAPGLSPGILSWMGSIPMGPTGSIAIELEGTMPGTEHDLLNVSADLVLNAFGPTAGTLEVTAPSFVPADGDRFAVLTFRERLGNFTDVNLPEVDGVAFDTLWVEDLTNAVPDTLYIVATGTGTPAPVNRWQAAASGDWSNGANWSAGVPTATDSVVIDVDGTYTVTLDVDATVRNLTIGGASGTQTLAATSRTLTIGGSSAVNANGELILANSTVAGGGALRNSGSISLTSGTISTPLTNAGGHIGTTGTPSFTSVFRNLVGSTLTLGALAGHTTLTVLNGFTNEGTIELTNTGSAYNAALAVTNGAFVNQGTLAILPGLGGLRTLAAELDNQGTLTLEHTLTIDRADAAHVNSASVSVATVDLLIAQSPAGSFTNTGAITIASGRTFTVVGGTVDLDQGTVSGAGRLQLGGTAVYEFLTSTVTAPMVIGSGVTIPANVTVPVGETLTLVNGSVVDEPIVNQGTIFLAENVHFNGSLTMASGSLMRLGALAGHTALTVANGFTNEGTIELTNTGSAYNAALAVTNGTLVNQGTLAVLPGLGGLRTLAAELDNQGTLALDHPLTIDRADAAHVNNASIDVSTDELTILQSALGSFTNNAAITIAGGRTLTVSGGTVDLDQGSVSGAGTLSIAGTATYEFFTSTVTAPMVIASAVTIPANVTVPLGQTLTLLNGSVIDEPIDNQGTILLAEDVTFTGSLTMASGSLMRLGALAGHTTLTVANGFTNEGTIELTNTGSAYNTRLAVASGALTNEGTIRISAGLGGQRFLSLGLMNDGTLQLDHLLTIDGAFADHVNNATIDVTNANLEVLQSAVGSFTNFGAITVASGRTLSVTGGRLDLDEGTLSGVGTLVVGTGTELEFTTSTVTTPMRVFAGATIPNDVTVPSGETLSLLDGSVIDEPIDVQGGTIRTAGTVTFNGSLTTTGLVRVGAFAGHSLLTVANGFTNQGTIELTNTGSAYNAALAVTNGTLVNEGTLWILPGVGGARTLAAELDNQGSLTLDHPLTIDRTDAAHVNNTLITLPTDDLTIVQSPLGSFTNNGTISVGPQRTVTVLGGTLDLDQGAMSGSAARLSVGAGATFEFTPGTVTIPMTIDATVTIPGDVTVGAGQILTLLDNTVIDEPIDNSGTIIVAEDVVFNGALTMATVGSVLRVGGLAGHAVLTVANGFTNLGTIELTSFGAAYNSTLDVVAGSILNQGSVTPLAGNGGTRTLDASLDNQGLIPMSYSMTVTGALNQLSSPGNITLSVTGTTLTVGGLMTVSMGTFTTANPGTSIVTLGGCVNSGGTISGWTCTPP